jgi:serine/threonine-protein kinase HipA
VAAAVDRWQAHFAECGVGQRDIALYAEQIDRPFLRTQRAEAMRAPTRRGAAR